jgi:PAS domain S-box-containing protein
MNPLRKWQQKLSVQMVITSIGLVFLTASAIGAPAVWILRSQLERQAWALVAQGSQTTMAILSAKQSDLDNLAILTAQRPTLKRLVEQDDRQELALYLEVLREGAGLDLLLLCRPGGGAMIRVGDPLGQDACCCPDQEIHYEPGQSGAGRGWLTSSQTLETENETITVLVGAALDDAFAAQLRAETGLEQILLYGGAYLGSSFEDSGQVWQENRAALVADSLPGIEAASRTIMLEAAGASYFTTLAPYGSDGLELVVSMPAADILAARRQLTWALAAGILVVAAFSSALGVARSRRISRPLERLRRAAEELRRGRLSDPIRVDTQIEELALLSFAFDDARIAIYHTLTELNLEKAWTEHILESVVEGIVTIDRRGRVTFFSRGAEQITGWGQEQALGLSIDELLPLHEEEGRFSERLPKSGGKQKIVVRLPDGSPATLAVTGASLAPPEAGKADTALVLRDVTNEEAIRRLLGDFLANITHEFRTPLSALSASIELLLDRLPQLEQHELEELLNSLYLGTLSLQQLIDNLLEGASIETGRFQVMVKTTGAAEIITEAARLVQPLVNKYDLSLRLDLPDDLRDVRADYRRSVQVMVNLLSNAAKWSPSGSEILVSAVPLEDYVEVCVCDRGPGIPPRSSRPCSTASPTTREIARSRE